MSAGRKIRPINRDSRDAVLGIRRARGAEYCVRCFRRLLVCKSVSLSVVQLRCANTAERIEILFGVESLGYPRNIVSNGGPDPPTAMGKGVGKV